MGLERNMMCNFFCAQGFSSVSQLSIAQGGLAVNFHSLCWLSGIRAEDIILFRSYKNEMCLLLLLYYNNGSI